MQSMTAFAQLSKKIPLGKVYLEIRSLNHRYFEPVFHLPEGFNFLEEKIKKELEKKVQRGRINVFVNLEQEKFIQPQLNVDLIKKYFQQIKKIKNELGLSEEPDLRILMNLPQVVRLDIDEQKKHNLWRYLKPCLLKLQASFLEARLKEGKAIEIDLTKRIEIAEQAVKNIKKRLPLVIKTKTKDVCLAEELAKTLKDIDISEELMRIEFHLENFLKTMQKKNLAIGKELDFITQEIQREANTMAAKSQDAPISSLVVNIKSQIEKIREQLQNVE